MSTFLPCIIARKWLEIVQISQVEFQFLEIIDKFFQKWKMRFAVLEIYWDGK